MFSQHSFEIQRKQELFFGRSTALSNWKKQPEKNQGFNGIQTRDLRDTGAMLYQLSYEATHWERGQFIEFMSPIRSEMTWSIYEIIHIWTADVDKSEEWSLQLIFQLTTMIILHFHVHPQFKYVIIIIIIIIFPLLCNWVIYM